jgi:heme exporter protein D
LRSEAGAFGFLLWFVAVVALILLVVLIIQTV